MAQPSDEREKAKQFGTRDCRSRYENPAVFIKSAMKDTCRNVKSILLFSFILLV